MTRSSRQTACGLGFALLTLVSSAACGNRIVPLGPSGNPNTVALTVESFVGVLPVEGSSFYSFTVTRDGPVSLTLLSLTENGEPSAAAINIGIGVPQGTGCTLVDSRTAGVDVKPQFQNFYAAAVYCARVADTGNLTSDADFALNIAYPKPLQ